MSGAGVEFDGIHVFVASMVETKEFYRHLGLEIEGDENFGRAELADGLSIAFGSPALSLAYDPQWREPSGNSPNAIEFRLASREAVDAMYAELTGAGYHGHLPPIDAFWGSRYAEVDDPNGNVIGLQSPQDPARGGPPPGLD